jgi:hypothetical protein
MTRITDNLFLKFLDKNYREYATHILCSGFFKNRTLFFFWKTWKNTVQRERPQMTIWSMRSACWIPKATNTHTGFVILIDFLQGQWLHKRASMLRHSYIACLVIEWLQLRSL